MAASEPINRRTASRLKRRRQLIDATMKCIARKGIGNTSIGDVASEAGLSQGSVNLHFETKDNLLTETLRHLSDEYTGRFDETLASAGPGPAERLLALMRLDFSPAICDRRKLAVWYAFYGEVKSRPTYRAICAKQDQHYDDAVAGLCQQLIDDGGYVGVSARHLAMTLQAISNGLWLDYLVSPADFNHNDALAAIDTILAAVFPGHFPLESANAH